MKVLLVGPLKSNAPHGAECGIANALDKLAYPWDYFDPRLPHTQQDIIDKAKANVNADLVLVLGCTPWNDFLETFSKYYPSIPIVNWNSEEIRLPEYRERVDKFGYRFKHIFHFDESALPIYKEMGLEASFMPQGYDPNRHRYIDVGPRVNSVVFIGSVGGKHWNRQKLIYDLKAAGIPILYQHSMDPEYNSQIYSKAAACINLGLSINPDKPYESHGFQQRVFEAWGSSCPVITNRPVGYPETNRMDGLFENGNILFYDDNPVDVVRAYLSSRDNIDSMVWCAKNMKSLHTYYQRLITMEVELRERGIIG
jgi:hypothetical protein